MRAGKVIWSATLLVALAGCGPGMTNDGTPCKITVTGLMAGSVDCEISAGWNPVNLVGGADLQSLQLLAPTGPQLNVGVWFGQRSGSPDPSKWTDSMILVYLSNSTLHLLTGTDLGAAPSLVLTSVANGAKTGDWQGYIVHGTIDGDLYELVAAGTLATTPVGAVHISF